VCCSVLQRVAASCNTLQCLAVLKWRRSTRCLIFADFFLHTSPMFVTHCAERTLLEKTPTTHCNKLQQTATPCNTLQHHFEKRSLQDKVLYGSRITTLQHTTPHCTTLHQTASHCTTLHHTAPQCTTLYHTVPHCITLHNIPLHCTTLHHTALHCTTLHYTGIHCNTLQHTAPYRTAPHCTT